jgi:predicted TIM-barrel fold metal-dependent hydrolase
MHTHLLSGRVKFDRLYDKMAILFFARRLGANPIKLMSNSYDEYVKTLISCVRNSKHIEKIALFGIDEKIDENGNLLHKDTTVCASNDDTLEVFLQNKDVVIPFFSINPLRKDALKLIDNYADLGFKGAKFMQNYWEIDTNDIKFAPYFEKLKARNLPLIFHIGSESSLPSNRRYESLDMIDQALKIGVKVIVAHMALSYEPLRIFNAFRRNPKYFSQDYFKLLDMLEKYDNLYADISALLTPVRAKVLRHLADNFAVHNKLLYGSDYPVPFLIMLNSYDLPLFKRLKLVFEKNPFDRYAKTIMEYFPPQSPIYANYKKVLDI